MMDRVRGWGAIARDFFSTSNSRPSFGVVYDVFQLGLALSDNGHLYDDGYMS